MRKGNKLTYLNGFNDRIRARLAQSIDPLRNAQRSGWYARVTRKLRT